MMRTILLVGVSLTVLLALLLGGPCNISEPVSPSHDDEIAPAGISSQPSHGLNRDANIGRGETRLLQVDLRTTDGSSSGAVTVIAMSPSGGGEVISTEVPGRFTLPIEEDLMGVIIGGGVVPQLVWFPEDPERPGFCLIELVATGGLQIQVNCASGEDVPLNTTASIVLPNVYLESLLEGVTGVPLDARLGLYQRGNYLGLVEAVNAYSAELIDTDDFIHSMLELCGDDQTRNAFKSDGVTLGSVGKFSVEIGPGGAATIDGLPSSNGFRWKLNCEKGFVVEPVERGRNLSDSEVGFQTEVGGAADWVHSAEFRIPSGAYAEVSAVVFDNLSLKGSLDFLACETTAPIGTIRLHSVVQTVDSQGATLTSYDAEAMAVADDFGNFVFAEITPGLKRLSCVWGDGEYEFFVANRLVDVPRAGVVDIGIIRALTGIGIELNFPFQDSLGVRYQWEDLFTDSSNPGRISLLLKNKTEMRRTEEDFWDAIFPRLGRPISIRGVAEGTWHGVVMAESPSEVWPSERSGLLVDRGMREFDLVVEGFVSKEYPFLVAKEAEGRITVLPPVGLDLGNFLMLRGTSFGPVSKGLLDGSVGFVRDDLGRLATSVASHQLGEFLLLRTPNGSEPCMVGWTSIVPGGAENGEGYTVQLVNGITVSGALSLEAQERLAGNVLKFDIAGCPSGSEPHYLIPLDADGAFDISSVPTGAVLIERSLGVSVDSSASDILIE